ncbi:hypothetical protein GPJ61_00135 [Brevibacillus formosus]|uniref:type II toxin-antitoxin system PemK/MazF family toxin n=1 Tax=Brevibacillus formosus TaxID=54913 RepID=UPI001C676B60|nr:type II toxin-antitoxin system PemK/MazF family toxin [Brevibacillus formosus]MBW5466281.1 hypothetical protein [Brevibacillus formosus]
MSEIKLKRGDVFMANLYGIGSEHRGEKLVLIWSGSFLNNNSNSTIVVPITRKVNKKKILPCQYELPYQLKEPSVVLFEQIRTIRQQDLLYKVAHIKNRDLEEMTHPFYIQLGLSEFSDNELSDYINSFEFTQEDLQKSFKEAEEAMSIPLSEEEFDAYMSDLPIEVFEDAKAKWRREWELYTLRNALG